MLTWALLSVAWVRIAVAIRPKAGPPADIPLIQKITQMNDSPNVTDVDDDRAELFIQLLAEHERRLTSYVLTFVPQRADADDLLQETKLALWKSFDQFQTGTNFGAWARKAAFNRILDYRKRKGRESKRLVFSDACLQRLGETFEQDVEQREEQSQHLSKCVAKLSRDHRQIISFRYNEGMQVEQLAERIDRTVSATYRVLSRIRLTLRDCVSGNAADFATEAAQ